MNVLYGQNYAQRCNSQCLGGTSLPSSVSAFIDLVRADSGLRWGGDFTPKDSVHIDDGISVIDPVLWQEKYLKAQSNPSCRLNRSTSPTFGTNFQTGQPGSIFTAIGANFEPNTEVALVINNVNIGSIMVDANGKFQFFVQTRSDGSVGYYDLQVLASTASALSLLAGEGRLVQRLLRDNEEPLREKNVDVSGSVMEVPENLEPLKLIYLPIIQSTEIQSDEIGP